MVEKELKKELYQSAKKKKDITAKELYKGIRGVDGDKK
jgi:hypothetical protein